MEVIGKVTAFDPDLAQDGIAELVAGLVGDEATVRLWQQIRI